MVNREPGDLNYMFLCFHAVFWSVCVIFKDPWTLSQCPRVMFQQWKQYMCNTLLHAVESLFFILFSKLCQRGEDWGKFWGWRLLYLYPLYCHCQKISCLSSKTISNKDWSWAWQRWSISKAIVVDVIHLQCISSPVLVCCCHHNLWLI